MHLAILFRPAALVMTLLFIPSVIEAQSVRADTARLRFGWTPGSTVRIDYRKDAVRTVQESTDSLSSAWVLDLRVRRDRDLTLLELLELRRETATALAAPDTSRPPIAALAIDRRSMEPKVHGAPVLAQRLLADFAAPGGKDQGSSALLSEIVRGLQSSEGVANGILASYSNIVAFWLDADLEVGSEYETESAREIPLMPGRTLPAVQRFAVTRRLPCERGRSDTSCVRLVVVEEFKTDSVRAMLALLMQERGVAAEAAGFENVEMSRRVEIVAEPWSLVPYAFSSDVDLRVRLQIAGAGAADIRQHGSERMWLTWERARPPLHAAAVAGNERAARAALRDGAAVDFADDEGVTALYRAAAAGHEAVARRLIREKANTGLAERLARGRGDVAALRVLRKVGRIPTHPERTFAAAESLLAGRRFDDAVAVLTDVAAAEAKPAAGHGRLAEALALTGHDSAAIAVATQRLAVEACDESALRAMRMAYDLIGASGSVASVDTAAMYAERLVRCAPRSPDAWYGRAWHAARAGDSLAEAEALTKLAEHRLFSDAQLALGRWYLSAVAPRAVLVVGSDVDFVTLRQLQQGGLRPDVVVVESRAIELASYVRSLRDRHALPLPFSDAGLDSLDAAAAYWGDSVVNHWRAQSSDGTLDRGVALAPAVSRAGLHGPGALWGNGALLVLGDTGYASAADPLAVLARMRAAAAIAGPATVPGDPQSWRREYELTLDVLDGAIAFLNSVTLDAMTLTPAQHAAADSLVEWLDRASHAVEWPGRADLLSDLATSRMELRSRAFTRGDRTEARRQALRASELAPEQLAPRMALATSALLARRTDEAVKHVERALELDRDFDVVMQAANVMRLAGRPDASLTLLKEAQQLIDDTPEEDREKTVRRRLLHLPAAPGDTAGPVPSWTSESFSERAAHVWYLVALAEGMREDLSAADAALGRARGLAISGPVRCWVRNLLQSTMTAVALTPRAAEWFRLQEAQFSCPPL